MMEEKLKTVPSGWVMFPIVALGFVLIPILLVMGILRGMPLLIALTVLVLPIAILFAKGLFTLQPNEARVLILFGKYVGTVRKEGFHWDNPFSVHRSPWETVQAKGKDQPAAFRSKHKYKVSLRARNFETQVLKVNDQRGNPIEIGAVVVWRVSDTAVAPFLQVGIPAQKTSTLPDRDREIGPDDHS